MRDPGFLRFFLTSLFFLFHQLLALFIRFLFLPLEKSVLALFLIVRKTRVSELSYFLPRIQCLKIYAPAADLYNLSFLSNIHPGLPFLLPFFFPFPVLIPSSSVPKSTICPLPTSPKITMRVSSLPVVEPSHLFVISPPQTHDTQGIGKQHMQDANTRGSLSAEL